MDKKEKLLTYSWKEFLKTPFSLMFFGLMVVITILVNSYRKSLEEDKQLLNEKYQQCVEGRISDKDLYLNILHEIEVSKRHKQNDSVK